MQVRHQSRSTDTSIEVSPYLLDGGDRSYHVRCWAGSGRGGPNEPSVSAVMSTRDLREFTSGLIHMLAKEESRG